MKQMLFDHAKEAGRCGRRAAAAAKRRAPESWLRCKAEMNSAPSISQERKEEAPDESNRVTVQLQNALEQRGKEREEIRECTANYL